MDKALAFEGAIQVSWDNVTGKPDSYPPESHTHAASQISAGTLSGQVKANASATTDIGTSQIRNIYAGTSDIGVGAFLYTGAIYLVYE